MARRVTVFLLAFAALLGPMLSIASAASVLAESGAVQARGCCGSACRCAETCPCVAKNDRGAPAGDAPPAPPPARDQRTFLLHLPALASALLSDLPLRERVQLSHDSEIHLAPSGREILAIVSRWTT